jgi:hypothetical protein
MKKSQQGFDF